MAPPAEKTEFELDQEKSERFAAIRDFRAPLEAEPGWVVDDWNDKHVNRAQLLSVGIPPQLLVRTNEMLSEATKLADRGALFAAKQHFLGVFRVTCQSLDASSENRFTHVLWLGDFAH